MLTTSLEPIVHGFQIDKTYRCSIPNLSTNPSTGDSKCKDKKKETNEDGGKKNPSTNSVIVNSPTKKTNMSIRLLTSPCKMFIMNLLFHDENESV